LGGATVSAVRPDEGWMAVIQKISPGANAMSQQYGTGMGARRIGRVCFADL
jgi:hypothetical protein